MYYAAYLSEEIMGGGFTIAPSCAGSRIPASRCTFNEFMEYIWAEFPEKGDLTRPTVTLFDEARTNFATCKLATILQKMNNYKKTGMSKPITGNIDSGRLFPGSSDYYEAMRRCGSVVKQMRTFVDTMSEDDPKKDVARKLLERAKEAAAYVVDIRAREMDHNEKSPRIKDLQKKLGFPLATKPGRDSTGRLGPYTVWDPAQSARDRPEESMNIAQQYADWMGDPSNNNRYV